MKNVLIAGLLVLAAWTGVAEEQKQRDTESKTNAVPKVAATPTAKSAARDPYTIIGYLEKRDRVVTIKSGPKGPVYSVATKDGKMLLENVTADQLRAQAPEIHQLIKTGTARGDARVQASAILDSAIR